MDVDRRSLLRAAAGTVVASFVPIRFMGIAGAQTGASSLTMASFKPYVNTSFRFQVGTRSITMPLSKVTDERSAAMKATPGAGECFSLIFVGALPAFGQGTYTVDHAALGRLSLFAVPVGRRTSGQDYQVLFNRCTA